MRYLAILLLSFCLTGCVTEAEKQRELEYKTALSACGGMTPVRWARCLTEAENRYWDGVRLPYRDLLFLKQARRAETASRWEQGLITKEQATVELAMMESQITGELHRRRTSARIAAAQEDAVAAAIIFGR
jgi:hypothetical protein